MTLTINGALQTRGKEVYSNKDEKCRKQIRGELKRQLSSLEKHYRQGVSEVQHLENIKHLAYQMTNKFSKDLEGGRFRIGIAQKALNLHLKYMWCMGLIKTPPHCPFDARIIAKLAICQGVSSWTESDNINDYQRWVSAAKVEAQKKSYPSLSDWELQVFRAPNTLPQTR